MAVRWRLQGPWERECGAVNATGDSLKAAQRRANRDLDLSQGAFA